MPKLQTIWEFVNKLFNSNTLQVEYYISSVVTGEKSMAADAQKPAKF
jgi:hypothetical protein